MATQKSPPASSKKNTEKVSKIEEDKKIVKTVKATKSDSKLKKLTAPIYDITGETKGEYDLPEHLFAVEVKPSLIAQSIRVYLANQRQGTASTKTRSEVNYSTRKIYRQKGTGRARHGSKRAPIFVGGGVTFGPRPADKGLKINKKQSRLALLGSLSQKAKDNKLIVLRADTEKSLKTSGMQKLMLTLTPTSKQKSLFATCASVDQILNLSTKNLATHSTIESMNLNTYAVINSDYIIFSESGLEKFIDNKNLSKKYEN